MVPWAPACERAKITQGNSKVCALARLLSQLQMPRPRCAALFPYCLACSLQRVLKAAAPRASVPRHAVNAYMHAFVHACARAQVHLSGDARWSWTHGTRVGIPIDPKDAPVTQATPPDKPPVEGAGAMLRQTSQTHKDAASGASGSVPASLYGLHDFWGTPAHVVVRGTERHSVVLAFAAG